jgi:hypothetical protein
MWGSPVEAPATPLAAASGEGASSVEVFAPGPFAGSYSPVQVGKKLTGCKRLKARLQTVLGELKEKHREKRA